MKSTYTPAALKECIHTYIASLPLPGGELTSADVEKGQHCKQALVQAGAASVPLLLDRLGDPDFQIKDLCYDLILEIGEAAQPALYDAIGTRGPIIDTWIAGMLKHLGDARAMENLRPLLSHPDVYVRHLSALALAFHYLDSPAMAPEELYAGLVEALENKRLIEGAPFTISGSALACLTRLSGRNFLDPPKEMRFYNFEHFLYPPPVHPFPFAADFFSQTDETQKRGVRSRVREWVADHSN